MLASFCMLISHALLSTNSFLLVDSIGRRFKTRLITEVNGINFMCPKLFLVSLLNLLVFLGFPGSIMFVAEILLGAEIPKHPCRLFVPRDVEQSAMPPKTENQRLALRL